MSCRFVPASMVMMLNVPAVEPAAMVTFSGTKAAVPVVQRSMIRPPAGAAAVSVTVPLELRPPTTVAGFMDTPESPAFAEAGVMLSVALRLTVP